MQVGRSRDDAERTGHQTTHRDVGRRDVRGDHPGIGHDNRITGESVAVAQEEIFEVWAPHLLLALDEQLQVDRKRSGCAEPVTGGLDLVGHLALVVDRPPGEQLVTDDHRLEGWMGPCLQRIDRLDVVMAVDQHRGRIGPGAGPLRVHRGMPGRGEDLDQVESGVPARCRSPLGRVDDIALVGRIGRDRRNRTPLDQPPHDVVGVSRSVTHRRHPSGRHVGKSHPRMRRCSHELRRRGPASRTRIDLRADR